MTSPRFLSRSRISAWGTSNHGRLSFGSPGSLAVPSRIHPIDCARSAHRSVSAAASRAAWSDGRSVRICKSIGPFHPHLALKRIEWPGTSIGAGVSGRFSERDSRLLTSTNCPGSPLWLSWRVPPATIPGVAHGAHSRPSVREIQRKGMVGC